VDEEKGQQKYDLEERTFLFAQSVRRFFKKIPKTMSNHEDGRQLIRSSGSVGANYIEANELLGDKDFLFHVKVSRKESKESRYWLRLLDVAGNSQLDLERSELINEATELTRIFGAIIRNRSS
jgi:four helix bundle protein